MRYNIVMVEFLKKKKVDPEDERIMRMAREAGVSPMDVAQDLSIAQILREGSARRRKQREERLKNIAGD